MKTRLQRMAVRHDRRREWAVITEMMAELDAAENAYWNRLAAPYERLDAQAVNYYGEAWY